MRRAGARSKLGSERTSGQDQRWKRWPAAGQRPALVLAGGKVAAVGLTRVTVSIKGMRASNGTYETIFLVDTGATDTLVPGSELKKIGIEPIGMTVYELADGSLHEYPFGLAEIAFMGEITAGRVIFGPDNAEPILGVTALESVGITVDPANRTLKRLPAIPLK